MRSWKPRQGRREDFFAANERFHLRLLEMEGNRWRIHMVTDLRRLMKLNRHHSLFREGRLSESLQEHRDLLQALLRRDPSEATRLTRAHFQNGLSAASHQGSA